MSAQTEATVRPRLLPAGSRGLLFDVAQGTYCPALQSRVLTFAATLRGHAAIEQVVPGMNNLLLVLLAGADPYRALATELFERWGRCHAGTDTGRLVEIPVIYGGAVGEDLAWLAGQAGLTPAELVELHSGAEYHVACLGAMAGFPYLGGLDPRLATARRAAPRIRVQQGAVIIGGPQAAIMPGTGPSGWHIIGHTSVQLFDPAVTPATLLQPGDRVRFQVEDFQP